MIEIIKNKILKTSNKINILVLYALLWIIEISCYLLREPVNHFSILPFFGSMLMTCLIIWVLLTVISLFVNRILRIALSIILGLLLSSIALSSIVIYLEFGEFLTGSKFQFFTNNASYMLAFAKTYLLSFLGLVYALILVVFSFLIYKIASNMQTKRKSFKREYILLPLAIILYFVGLNQFAHHSKNYIIDINTSFASAIKMVKIQYPGGFYRSSNRIQPEPFIPQFDCNVMLIVNESFGIEAFAIDDSTSMPLLKKRMNEYGENAFHFTNAFSNSNATDVSVSSIITGVLPYESKHKLHKMPFIWQWFKVGGYSTGFISAQKNSWMGFDIFFDNFADINLSADQIKEPFSNDGIDDGYMSGLVCHNIEKLKQNKRFFLYYNSNALHNPFLQSSKFITVEKQYDSKLKNAANLLDKSLDSIFNYLSNTQILENTIIIITGDHGESDKNLHKHNRLVSYYDEIQKVPMIMLLPQSVAVKFGNQMRLNVNSVIGNADILPTILDLLNVNSNPKNLNITKDLLGKSLIKPIDENRYQVSLNTNDIRQWEREGFGIFFKNTRFLFTDLDGPEYYNIQSDPQQKSNIWNEISSNERQKVLNIIDSIFHLKRMYKAN